MSLKFEWYEDMKSIMIKIPIKGVSMKKIDVYMSDLVLKVNVSEIKMVKLLDLKNKIDFESTENHVINININKNNIFSLFTLINKFNAR
jgi:hypothetical protein